MWYEFSSSQSQLLPTQNVTSNNNNKEINITMRLNPGKGTSSFDLPDFHGPKFFNSLNIEIQNIGFLFLLSQQMLQTDS